MYPGRYAELHPDRPAFIMASTGEAVTYRDYEARANQLAHLLRRHGLARLDHYAIYMENNNRYLETCGAGERSGLYYTCVNSYLTAEELAYIVDNSDSKVLVTSATKLPVARDALAMCPKVTLMLVVDLPAAEDDPRIVDYATAIAEMPTEPIPDESLGTAMLYSSGTTGRPKGITRPLPEQPPGEPLPMHSFVNGLWQYREDMIYLSPTPLYHAAPYVANSLTLRMGGTAIIMERFDPVEYLRLIEKYRVTHTQLVPTMFSRMLKLPEEERTGHDLSSLEMVVHAAAPCPAPVKEQMIEWWGPIILEYYGATEGLGFTACNSEEWLTHRGTEPDPIIYLAGGRGGAGTLSAPGVVAGGMNANRDVIFVNQRGTVHSDPFLSCPEMDEFSSQSIGLVFATQSTADLDAAAIASCRERLTPTGVDFAAYNSLENAADIADLQVALGIKKWNVYGVSYGSDLAQQLLRDHPDGIRSVVLDSVLPTSINIVDRWWEAPASSLAAIAKACTDEPACAAAYPDLLTVFTKAVNVLNQTPAKVTVTGPSGQPVAVTVDGFKLIPLIVAWSNDQAKVADIPRMIIDAARGDVNLAAQGIVASDLPPEQRGLVGAGLELGAFCQEMTNWTTSDQALAVARKSMPGLPDAVLRVTPTGSYIFDECRAWGLGKSDPAARMPASSELPTLILSGTFDSNVSPAWVDDIIKGFPNSVVLHFPGIGHGVLPTSACAQSIMTDFLDNPRPDVDRSCIANTKVPTLARS